MPLLGYVEFVTNGSYPDWATFTKATRAYLRRRERDHHDTRIFELADRRKVA